MASHSDQSWIYFSCVLVHQKSLMHPQLSVSLLSWVWLKPMLDPSICSQTVGCKITLDLSWLLGPQSEFLETTQNHLKLGRSCYLLPLVMGIDLSWSVANTASQELICTNLLQACFVLYFCREDEYLPHRACVVFWKRPVPSVKSWKISLVDLPWNTVLKHWPPGSL